MFECTLECGDLFRKIVTALNDLVEQGNFMIDGNMISFQGMDSSHVSLVALQLKESGFEAFRCDRDICLGIQFSSLAKILKCMAAKDSLSIRAEDDGDVVQFMFQSPDQKRFSNFELKLNDIDQEQLGIPETEYGTCIRMPSTEFQRICRDLSQIGDTVNISATKDGVKFSVNGDIGSGDMTLQGIIKNSNKKKKKAVKKVKKESNDDDDEDHQMGGGDNEQQNDNQEEEEEEEEDDEQINSVDDVNENEICINLEESVQQTFSLRYLNNFTKATGLSKCVTLRMGANVPLEVEYAIENFGNIRYYLAPKLDDEDE